MNDDVAYILGETPSRLTLETVEDNRRMSLMMAEQARYSIRIASRSLDAPIYDTEPFAEALSLLVRSNHKAFVHLLVNETDTVVKHGHRLVELSQKLSSFVSIRRLGEMHKEFNQAFLIVDERGVIYRNLADRYEAECSFNDPRRARELATQFQEMWDMGETDPSLMRLHI